jgi:hypothetical protein
LVPGAAPPARRRFPRIRLIRGEIVARICLYSILLVVWASVFIVGYYRFHPR